MNPQSILNDKVGASLDRKVYIFGRALLYADRIELRDRKGRSRLSAPLTDIERVGYVNNAEIYFIFQNSVAMISFRGWKNTW